MRTATDEIRKKRSDGRSVVFFTGGTSFCGGCLAAELLRKNYRLIFLCRPKDGFDPADRVRRTLNWFGYDEAENYEVLEGTVTLPNLGLNTSAYEELAKRVDEVFHAAANTTFLKEEQEEVERVNVQGTYNVLKLAAESSCYFFHHLSTVYVAGSKQGLCSEEYIPQSTFNNAYEKSKHQSEGLVLETCVHLGIRANIYRPSIVYGDSETGRSLIFNSIYYPLRTLHYLKRTFERDLREGGGKSAEKMGVRREEDGKLYLPIRYEFDENTTLNAVPIDFLRDACITLMEECLDGDILHIVRTDPQSLKEIIAHGERFLNVCGLTGVAKEEFDLKPRTALEKIFDSYLDIYHPYLYDAKVFDDSKAGRLLEKHDISCPKISYPIAERCMSYALQVNWGEKIFDEIDEKPLAETTTVPNGPPGQEHGTTTETRNENEVDKSEFLPRYSKETIQSWIQEKVAIKLGVPSDAVDIDEPIVFLGMTSHDALDILTQLCDRLSMDISPAVFYDQETIRELAEHLLEVISVHQSQQ